MGIDEHSITETASLYAVLYCSATRLRRLPWQFHIDGERNVLIAVQVFDIDNTALYCMTSGSRPFVHLQKLS